MTPDIGMTAPAPRVLLYDEFSPEDLAMMQALYSRSAQSASEHAKKVQEVGSGKFMAQYYVGYGHKSIADCGSTTLFIEGVSMLAAKAIQDNPLYSGQETSSRYIDYSKQPMVDPLDTPESRAIMQRWMDFYCGEMENVKAHLRTTCPRAEDEKEGMYERALAAWAFDIMRGFLPAGITTQLSWHTNLRQAWDKLSQMRWHPLPEVAVLAEQMLTTLRNRYQNSFCFESTEVEDTYAKEMAAKHTYFVPRQVPEDMTMTTTIRPEMLDEYEDTIQNRPRKSMLPVTMRELGDVQYTYRIDFGSFRDLQRHRNGVCRMPLLTTNYGFQEWYLQQLPEATRERAENLIAEQKATIDRLDAPKEIKQYYVGMGFNVWVRGTYGLPGLIYMIELRSGRTVHPTVRAQMHKMHHLLQAAFPNLLLHSDLSADDRDVRRGGQTIEAKQTVTA